MSELSDVVTKHLKANPPMTKTHPAGWLTAKGMIDTHPDLIKFVSDQGGYQRALKERPELKDILRGRGESLFAVRHAVTIFRKKHKPSGRKYGKRGEWSPEQFQLVRTILNDPKWRTPKGGTRWAAVFAVHPEWAEALNYNKARLIFNSFVTRVRRGGSGRQEQSSALAPQEIHAEPVSNGNGHGILINGKQYDLIDLEQIVKAHQNALDPMNFCPQCGLSLMMHTKAYSIARRHSQSE